MESLQFFTTTLYKYRSSISLVVSCSIFLLYKLLSLEFRFGDTTAYWFMANSLAQGVVPYRDFFLADPPFYILFLTPLVQLFRSHILILQLLPAVLEMMSAVGLFLFARHEKIQLYWLAPVLYLLSFTILSTSDYGTGLQLATVLYVAALLFGQRKKYWLLGVFLALSCLTKLYMVPPVLGITIYLLAQKKYDSLAKVIAGGVITAAVILLPFFLLSGKEVLNDIIFHHFTRPSGTSKIEVFSFFLMHEGLLVLLSGISFYFFKKTPLILPFLLQIIFFLSFKDVYYAYLGSLMPYLVLFSLTIFEKLKRKSENMARIREMVVSLLGISLIFGSLQYWRVVQPQGQFVRAQEWAQRVRTLSEDIPLYGSHEVTPLLALLSEKNLYANLIDTNGQTFASGVHDKEAISRAAAEQGVYLLTRFAVHPQTNQAVYFYEGFFSASVFEKSCVLLAADEKVLHKDDLIALFRCTTLDQ